MTWVECQNQNFRKGKRIATDLCKHLGCEHLKDEVCDFVPTVIRTTARRKRAVRRERRANAS